MARSLLDQQFVQEINKNSIFGNCNPDDFITADTERKEKMRKAAVERAARNKEEKLSEIKKKKQEEEDYKFACEEQERFDRIDRNSYSTMGRGRYAGEIPQRSTNSLPRPRGRGQLSEEEKNDNSQFFKKEINIKRQIQLANGLENYNNNQMMRQYWHGEQISPLENRFYSGARSPANFEDAESSSSSSFTNSPLLTSCSTTPEVCPPPAEAFVPPSPCEAVRKRGNRLAAKFSNPGVDENSDESTKSNEQIEVFMSAERPLAPFGLRNNNFPIGTPFDSVNASQRILTNDLPLPEDLYNSSSDNSFEYKLQDFPQLK